MTDKRTLEPRPPIYPAEWEWQNDPRYSLTLTWYPNPWETASVSGESASREQTLAALLQIAKAMGYTPPRW